MSEIQRYASWTLIQYFALARGWPPRSGAWTDALARAWWDDAGPAMFKTVQSAWVREGMRAHIRQLAVLNELCWELYPADEDDGQRRDLVVSVANDLGTWKAWPGLHDVRDLLLLPGAVAHSLQAEQLADFRPVINVAGTPNQGPGSPGNRQIPRA
ncbi:hypothetical protein ACFVTE_21220 [Arthrobacter sp. NPDC058097]|uniref:hypothetical protein n=1 Tax=Arthrobacter sp. NPDC058097 TaxID=3346340 RepID=UPI0036DAA4E8